jgi:hypothetical protein
MIRLLGGAKRLILVLLAASAPAAAVAEEALQGVLNAVSYAPFPSRQAIYVRALDNSDESLALKREWEGLLRAAGHVVGSDASALALTFRTFGDVGRFEGSRRLLSETAPVQSTHGVEADRYVVNLFDSKQGGWLNRRAETFNVRRSRFRLEATVEERGAGRTIWKGWTSADLDRGASASLIRTMVPPLVSALGQTVREQPIRLQ